VGPVACSNPAPVAPPHSTDVKRVADKTDVQRPATPSANTSTDTTAVKIVFPLSELFTPHVACRTCFTDGKAPVLATHSCRQDLLVVQSKQTLAWFHIRERVNHLEFPGKYHMCNQRPNPAIGKRCPRGDSCTFAHSEVERGLWMAEKLGHFDIRQFVAQAASRSEVAALHSVQSVMAKHPGQLAFLCSECYLGSHRVSMQSSSNPRLCSIEVHDWLSAAVLAHCSLAAGNITLISQSPDSLKAFDHALCLMGVFCGCRWKGECSHAHSVVERDIWYVQRDCGLTQRQIVQQVCHPLSPSASMLSDDTLIGKAVIP